MKGSDGQWADSHGGLIAQQHGAYPLPGLHTDTLDTPTNSVPYAPTSVSHALTDHSWQPTSICRDLQPSTPPFCLRVLLEYYMARVG